MRHDDRKRIFRCISPVEGGSGTGKPAGGSKVMKVAINPQKDCLRVYVLSRQWIHKKHIYHLEAAIKVTVFFNAPLQVKINRKIPALQPVYAGKISWMCTARVFCWN